MATLDWEIILKATIWLALEEEYMIIELSLNYEAKCLELIKHKINQEH